MGPTHEIFVMNADGTGQMNLTNNNLHERVPEWSPDGKHIANGCRPPGGVLEICVMDADGTNQTRLTHGSSAVPRVFSNAATWSPDGEKIAFHRGGSTLTAELWWIDNMQECLQDVTTCHEVQVTDTPGFNIVPNWGVVRITGQGEDQVAADSKGKNGTADHGKQHKAKDKGKKDHKHKKGHGGGKRHR